MDYLRFFSTLGTAITVNILGRPVVFSLTFTINFLFIFSFDYSNRFSGILEILVGAAQDYLGIFPKDSTGFSWISIQVLFMFQDSRGLFGLLKILAWILLKGPGDADGI